jgi:hypothetical protein
MMFLRTEQNIVNNHGRANNADIDDILIVRKLLYKKESIREKEKKRKRRGKTKHDICWTEE